MICNALQSKIITALSLSGLLNILRSNQQSIVFTNGCFDLLHPGHLDYLTKAKALGDVLILGINDDNSVKTLKGETRPINKLNDRMLMLAGLESVDFITPFSENTPLKLIKSIQPDFLVKGGDYTKDKIVGAEFVEEEGGKVEIIPFLEGYSSTSIIDRIKKL